MILFSTLAAVLLIYLRSIRGGFLFDDHAITDMHFERWKASYKGKIYSDRPARFAYALRTFLLEPRSLTHLGYLWTWRLAGFNPIPWHAVNIVLHLANTALVYLLAFSIRPAAAPIAALLFAVHPHQVAAVSYISGRAGLQMTFFSLAVVWMAIAAVHQDWRFAGGVFLCSLFSERSKEDGILWPMFFALTYKVLSVCFG